MRLIIEGGTPLRGEVEVPADKSMTHRALLFGAIAQGRSRIVALRAGADNKSTAQCIADLGVDVESTAGGWDVASAGIASWHTPTQALDCGNSGTTMRLLIGALAGTHVTATLTGDDSLMKRPMGRVCKPLRELGAKVNGRLVDGRETAPLSVEPGRFAGGEHLMNVASAQVKSALLLAGVASRSAVCLREPSLSRDHSERMLRAMGASIESTTKADGAWVELAAGAQLHARDVRIPGDISSAAFLLCAAHMVRDSKITIRHVGINPSRTGILDIFDRLGVHIGISGQKDEGGEPVAALTAAYHELRAPMLEGPFTVGGMLIPRLVDELVVLGALFSQARGHTEVHDASELRVKESDRIVETVKLLNAFGVSAQAYSDGYAVHGPQRLNAATVDVSGDHRLAMTAAVLALASPGKSVLEGFEIAEVSYPGFAKDLQALGARVTVEAA